MKTFRSSKSYFRASPVLLAILLLVACGTKSKTTSNGATEPFPFLGGSATFAALAGKSVINSGMTTVYGDIGVYPGNELSGISTMKSTGGTFHQNNSTAAKGQNDSTKAYNNLRDHGCDIDLSGTELGGRTLHPGTYCFAKDAHLNGLLTLDSEGNQNANFIFQIAGNLNTGNDSAIRMINNGETCNVFWQVNQNATLAGMTNFVGGILALGDITMGNNAKLNGKLLSHNGTIRLDSNEIYNNFCPWPGN